MSDSLFPLFVTSAAGLEGLVMQELAELGLSDLRETPGGVHAAASVEHIYRACLWLRTANRVLLVLAEAEVRERDDVYTLAFKRPWSAHFAPDKRLKVDFSGTNEAIRHSQFGAQVVKDGISDHFRQQGLSRPEVDLLNPDYTVNVHLTKHRAHIAIDLSGASLHRRGYRSAQGQAPIKETLAAAMLVRSGWPDFARENKHLIDPMCGSATVLIEAAMMASDRAPGLAREHWGFSHWQHHNEALWRAVHEEAKDRATTGLAALKSRIIGFEQNRSVAAKAKLNIEAAGFAEHIELHAQRFHTLASIERPAGQGLLLSNPPYGMRLGEPDELSVDYRTLADLAREHLPGWRMALISSNKDLLSETRLRFDKRYRLMNGPIPCELRVFNLRTREERESAANERELKRAQAARLPQIEDLDEGATMLAKRLQKNLRRLKKWRDAQAIECYRVYDADLPEYAAAIDVYGEHLHIQEYQAPANIDEKKVQARFEALVQATQAVFQLPSAQLHSKTRRRNRGKAQYEKLAELDEQQFLRVNEGPGVFLVNLDSYLDTGLFLDHRPLRLRLGAEMRGKDFLNLFCYTGSASVHAAIGGAKSTTNVDMSNTYLAWARRNFAENKLHSDKHRFERADVMVWLEECRRGYDVIMLDPPSFSNSKKMNQSFDVQRDHVALVMRCMELLKPGGCLYFSNNFRRFVLAPELYERFRVSDISADTIDLDFERNAAIHHCFKLESA